METAAEVGVGAGSPWNRLQELEPAQLGAGTSYRLQSEGDGDVKHPNSRAEVMMMGRGRCRVPSSTVRVTTMSSPRISRCGRIRCLVPEFREEGDDNVEPPEFRNEGDGDVDPLDGDVEPQGQELAGWCYAHYLDLRGSPRVLDSGC